MFMIVERIRGNENFSILGFCETRTGELEAITKRRAEIEEFPNSIIGKLMGPKMMEGSSKQEQNNIDCWAR